MMSATRHRIRSTTYSLTMAATATVVSAYFAGVLIGVFFPSQGQTLQYTLTFWGALHAVGGVFALVVTLPVILSLERANVRRILVHGQQ